MAALLGGFFGLCLGTYFVSKARRNILFRALPTIMLKIVLL